MATRPSLTEVVPTRDARRLLGLVAVLTFALATLTALAYGSPPDLTWISGLYDHGDHDDVVALLTSESGTAPESSRDRFARLGCSTILTLPTMLPVSEPGSAEACPRAPPPV